jgi:cardiolipin synthase
MIAKERIPNLLTYARAGAVPLSLLLMVSGDYPLALFWIFVLASITDFLDGYLARRWNCTGRIGAMLDPIADKLLVALMLIYLLHRYELPLLPVALILLREIYISGLREFLGGHGVTLPVSTGGKWKTALQMLAIATLIGSLAYGLEDAWTVGLGALWISAFLAIHSAVRYTLAAKSMG